MQKTPTSKTIATIKLMLRIKHLSLLSAVAVLRCFAFVNLSPAEDAWLRNDLYDRGSAAYAKNDYVVALENLYAFKEINKDRLKPSDFLRHLDEAISKCESNLSAIVIDVSKPSIGSITSKWGIDSTTGYGKDKAVGILHQSNQ